MLTRGANEICSGGSPVVPFSGVEEERSNFVVLFLSFVLIVCLCPPFVPLCHFCPFPLMRVDFAQGLLDDGRRASTIAMGLNKQDKDHLVVRQIPKRFTNMFG